MVQRRLKAVGLVVDLHFHGTQPVMELLDDVARRGVLYAIVITSQHEVHRSVTVNILHGTPQGKDQKLLAGIKTHNGKGFIGQKQGVFRYNKNWEGKVDFLCSGLQSSKLNLLKFCLEFRNAFACVEL